MESPKWKKGDQKVSYPNNPGSSPAAARKVVSQRKYGLISAKFKGPGPGKYTRQPCTGIKDHDFTKYTEPAYTIRVKSRPNLFVWESPGPCYYVDPSVSRLGLYKPTSFFMQQGRKSTLWPVGFMPTPAPNEYCVDKVHPPDEPNAPAYSMGTRTRYWLNSPIPGPNSYTLPRMLGPRLPVKRTAPCPSLASGACVWDPLLKKGPGPAAYSVTDPDIYLRHQPAYSISQRFIPSSKEPTPGPLDYDIEKVMLHKPQAPRFSLGVRHSEYVHGTPTICLIQE